MKKLIKTSIFCLLFTHFAFAQNTLKTKVQPSQLLKSEVSFHSLEKFVLYHLDGKAIYDFARKNEGLPFTLHLEIDENRDWEMELQPSKVHGVDYSIIMSTGEEIGVETNITYKGFLKNDPSVKVRMTIAENLIHGVIFDKETISFETIGKVSQRSKNDLMAVYKMSENNLQSGDCGHQSANLNQKQPPLRDKNDPVQNIDVPNQPSAMTSSNTYCAKLGVTLDWQGLNIAGSVANFNSDLQTIINIVNGYYDVFDVEYELNPVYVIANSPNPWTDVPGSQSQLVANYAAWAFPNLTPNDYNCSLLFTGTNMNGIGYAFFGHMCTNDALRYGEIDYQYPQPITQRANLTTHELGHLWDARHGFSSPNYIMSPSIYDGNLQWTSTSSGVISTSVNSTFNSCLPTCTAPSCAPYVDNDSDGYCSDVDCDDNDNTIHPNAVELCDGIDNDCDGLVDEGTCSYCVPIHMGSENELITNVTVGAINNSSGGWNTGTTGYSDYTNISTQLEIGTTYTITVTPNYSWTDSKMGIWADWNQNQTFEPNEEIASLSGAGPWTANFTPPSAAALSTTRLRVRLQFSSVYTPDPCAYSNFYSGETEDYSLEVVNTGCTGNEVSLELQLDDYPEETSWEIIDSNESTIASGGTYDGQENELVIVDICLPDDCYDFIIDDSYGDGICCDYGNGSYTLKDVNGQILASGGQFIYTETTNFCLGSVNGCNTQLVDSQDFELGWGIWNDGGTDARRNANDAPFANSGTFCIRLRDNTEASVMTTDILDLSGFSEITVNFSYIAASFENTEGFWLQISTDGGATFATEEDWIHTIDFQNDERHSPSVTISGPFSNSTQVRFRCDASGNGDKVYLDDVVISGCIVNGNSSIVLYNDATVSNGTVDNLDIKTGEINVYPNPVSMKLTVNYQTFEEGQTYINLYDLRGQKVLSRQVEISKGLNVFQLNVSELPQGMYLLNVQESNSQLMKKIMISR